MTDPPRWLRGLEPATSPRGEDVTNPLTGPHTEIPLPPVEEGIGLRRLYAFGARVIGAGLSLTDLQLTVEWSQFQDCHFTQRVRPVLNAQGIAAQGSFAITPSTYRGCTFERVRFNMLSGFNLGRALFEGCTFVNCRWEGHFAHDAWLVNNRFVGPMNGCAWFGGGVDGANLIDGNDFTDTRFTTNVAFRDRFPIAAQQWPPGYRPLVDD